MVGSLRGSKWRTLLAFLRRGGSGSEWSMFTLDYERRVRTQLNRSTDALSIPNAIAAEPTRDSREPACLDVD